MQQKILKTIFFVSFLAIYLLPSIDALAQKKKNKKKKGDIEVIQDKKASADEKRKAEMYHAEAEKYFILDDMAKAFVLYQRSLESDPANATAYYKIAQIYLKSKDIDKALYNAQKSIELDETNRYFYLLLADIYTKKSNFVEAANTYEKMIRLCKNSDEYLFELAAIYVYQENIDKALQVYDRIENIFGINEQVIAQKQKLYLQQSKLDSAIAEGEKLIKAFPGESRYVLLLAEILISNNQDQKAIPYLEALITDYPDNAQALLMLSDYYRKHNEVEKSNTYLNRAFAMNDLDIEPKLQVLYTFIQKLPNDDIEPLAISLGQKIISAHPDDPRSYEINGDLLLSLKKDEEALEKYKKSIALGATNFSAWQQTLQLEVKLERFEDAISDGEKALELFPNQAGLCWFLGNAYLAKKDYEMAINILERGKKLSNANEDLKSYFNAQLGDSYNSLKNYKKSDEAYEAALAHDPNNDHVLNNYSYFLSLRKEKLDLAKKMSSKLISISPDNSTYLDTHAWVLYVRGEYKESKYYIEKAVNGNDISGTIIEHYGDILFKLGDVDSAVAQWLKAKGMDDTSELIDKKIADRKLYE